MLALIVRSISPIENFAFFVTFNVIHNIGDYFAGLARLHCEADIHCVRIQSLQVSIVHIRSFSNELVSGPHKEVAWKFDYRKFHIVRVFYHQPLINQAPPRGLDRNRECDILQT